MTNRWQRRPAISTAAGSRATSRARSRADRARPAGRAGRRARPQGPAARRLWRRYSVSRRGWSPGAICGAVPRSSSSFCRSSVCSCPISPSASRRRARPSSWMLIVSSSVATRSSFTLRSVSTSTTPRSTSRPTFAEPVLSSSAFLVSSSLVVSVTCFCSSIAFCCRYRLMAMTIWFFHSGMVVSTDAWIFSTRFWSLLWMRRICGAVWMATMRVSLRSWRRRSKRVGRLLQVGEPLRRHDVVAWRPPRPPAPGA